MAIKNKIFSKEYSLLWIVMIKNKVFFKISALLEKEISKRKLVPFLQMKIKSKREFPKYILKQTQ
jgi:hypothetical protein